MSHSLLTGCTFLVLSALPAAAGYADDTGYTQLKAELGAAMLTGAGVDMTQVEGTHPSFPTAYMPQAGSDTFPGTGFWAGKSFTAKSGAALYAEHAYRVAQYMYGDNTPFPGSNSSMCPGVVDVDGFKAANWADEFLAPLPLQLAPATEFRDVQNHSWVSDASAAGAAYYRDLIRRQDFSINRDNYVACVGLNNGSLTPIPDIFAAAYNVISVGLTNGEHSRGTVTSDMDGPGRRKPEIVSPTDADLIATSFSTGYVSSAAGLLRAKANVINTANARNPKTIKAALLAGATKDEFPAWAKAATHPLDTVFGAGELNVYNSYHIMNGGEQPAGGMGGLPYFGWDVHSLNANTSTEYRLNIPAGMFGVELSAFIVWHRTPTDDPLVPGFSLANTALVNYDLLLQRHPAAGGAAVTIDSSSSTLYNLDHVWKKNLTAGNYRLRVTRASTAGPAHEYAIAWRLTAAPHLPQPQMTTTGSNFNFTFPGLITGHPYKFQSSPNMTTWTDIESFTAPGPVVTRIIPKPAVPRLLYRLLPVLP